MAPTSPSPCLLITGASRGIGAKTAVLAAQRGYAVCVNYLHRAEAAEEVCHSIAETGGRAIAVRANVAKEDEVMHLFETAARELGLLRGLVNNAGVLERMTTLDQFDAARLERVFSVNVVGAFLCAKQAVLRMSTRYGGTGGGIVNVSSAASRIGSPGEYIDYAASKGAIDTMTLGLAKEVAAEGIRVNAVRPGVIHTDIHASGGEPTRVDRVKASVPMLRGGHPEEVAEAILWFLSDGASYVTGALLDVAGGR